jgi:3-oxoacyl-[acyl-carrier protein] reductase
MEAAVAETIHRFGRLDIAVQSAGVVSGTPLLEVTDSEWDAILDTNLKGTLHFLQAVYPGMAAAGYGKIVCLGSIAGEQGGVMSGPHYVAAKAGIHAMIKWLAKAGAPHNVYVNAIAPGPVMTPMWIGVNKGIAVDDPDMSPLGRVGRPEDIAEAVLFLVSSMSNWITGTVLDVNGGMLMR